MLMQEKDTEGLLQIFYEPYFCKKRDVPLNLPYTHNDVILDLIKNYEVEINMEDGVILRRGIVKLRSRICF